MMTNWQDILLNYNFDVHYRPGILNVLPDALSRLFPASVRSPEIDAHVSGDNVIAYMQHIRPTEEVLDVVPEEERTQLLYTTHIMGHIGASAMVKAIQNDGKTWPHLTKACVDHIKSCKECQ
ncbi:hypothetical protein DFQ26_000696, partial [Actinomortierella ambigua]